MLRGLTTLFFSPSGGMFCSRRQTRVENSRRSTIWTWWKAVRNQYPDRFLFGTDVVAPRDEDHYLGVYRMYQPLWEALTPEARNLVLKGNYERVFDAAAAKVRQWEGTND